MYVKVFSVFQRLSVWAGFQKEYVNVCFQYTENLHDDKNTQAV